jgi:arylformamidase
MIYSTHLGEAVYDGDFQSWAFYYTMAYPMRIYDISVPLSPTLACYPGDPSVEVTPVAQLAQGDAANVSRVTLSSHSGTHLDAPRHFFAHGTTVDALDLEILLGPARVCLVTPAPHITADDLRSLELEGVKRVLFKTTNGALWDLPGFHPNYVALTASAAQLLVDMGIQLVGIDYLSIDAFERQDFPVHRILLGAHVLILEGLDLRVVPPGDYELIVLPLRLQDGDGAPARVILRY